MTGARRWDLLGLALACGAMAVLVLRAATQSIVHDEALTHAHCLLGPLDHVLHPDANNHALHTYLARASVTLLGHSELALRVPALVGAALVLGATVSLARATLDGAWGAAAVALVALNPYLLDLLCAARGYGLATGWLLLALALLARATDPSRRDDARAWALASVALGLALACSLAAAFVAIALAATAALWRLPWRSPRAVAAFAAPGPLLAVVAWAPILRGMGPGDFYVGHDRLVDAALDVASASLLHGRTGVVSAAAHEAGAAALLSVGERGVCLGAAAAALALLAWAAARSVAALRRATDEDPRGRAAILATGALVGALVLHALAPRWPPARAVVWALPLGTLALLLHARAAARADHAGARRAAQGAALALGGALLLAYLAALQTTHFRDWRYDAGVRAAYGRLLRERPPGAPPLDVGGSWVHEPALNYYRRRAMLLGHEPVAAPYWREDARRWSRHAFALGHPDDLPGVDPSHVQVLWQDPVSGVVLLRRLR